MSLHYSTAQVHNLIRQNEQTKKFFYKKYLLRFSDCIYDGKIHFSKYFEFFEMARFDLMHTFYSYLKSKKLDGNKQFGRDKLELGNFIVVRVSFNSYSNLELLVKDSVNIKTALIIHQKPLLEFEQIAFTESNPKPCVKANIKIAIVNEFFHKVDNWDHDILCAMIEFINAYGREDDI